VIVLGSVAVQWLLCRFAASAWWIPDCPWVAVVLVVSGWPRHWLLPVIVAGWLTMSWSVAAPVAVLTWYLMGGASLSVSAAVVDVTDERVQVLAAGVGELVWLFVQCWIQEARVGPLYGWMALHIALTMAAVPVLRRLLLWLHLLPDVWSPPEARRIAGA